MKMVSMGRSLHCYLEAYSFFCDISIKTEVLNKKNIVITVAFLSYTHFYIK